MGREAGNSMSMESGCAGGRAEGGAARGLKELEGRFGLDGESRMKG